MKNIEKTLIVLALTAVLVPLSGCTKPWDKPSGSGPTVLPPVPKPPVEEQSLIQSVISQNSKEITDGVLLREVVFTAHDFEQHMFAAEINLDAGWKLGALTPQDSDKVDQPKEETLDVLAMQAEKNGRNILMAINGDVFGFYHGSPVCIAAGIFIKNGKVIKPTAEIGFESVICSMNDGTVSLLDVPTEYQNQKSNVYDAIGGWHRLVWDGKIADYIEDEISGPLHPRTFFGISKDCRKLYLFVVDGRQTGWSRGITVDAAAEICMGFGCYRACNLDGGGSSSMILKGMDGSFSFVNKPCNMMPDKTFGPRKLCNGIMIYK